MENRAFKSFLSLSGTKFELPGRVEFPAADIAAWETLQESSARLRQKQDGFSEKQDGTLEKQGGSLEKQGGTLEN